MSKIMLIKAENRTGDESDIMELCLIEDVYYVIFDKKKRIPLFYTKYGTFYQIVTLDGLELGLTKLGYEMLDSVNLCNTNNIAEIDEKNCFVIYEEGVKASIVKNKMKRIKEKIGLD